MPTAQRTSAGEIATEIVLSIFRTNGVLLAAGDAIAGREGLTSARWQVMGAIELSDGPLTVPQIARRMGLTRQSVHQTVTNLVREGMAELALNVDHARSSLVSLTPLGRRKYGAVDRHQAEWVNELAADLSERDLRTAAQVLDALRSRIEKGTPLRSPEGGRPR